MEWWIFYISGVVIMAIISIIEIHKHFLKGVDITIGELSAYTILSLLSWFSIILRLCVYIGEILDTVIIKGKKR